MSSATMETCGAECMASQAGRSMLQLSDSPNKKSEPKVQEEEEAAPVQKTESSKKVVTSSKSKAKKAKSPDASNVALSEGGYSTIAAMCCNYEMEEYIRRVVVSEDLKVCDEGGMQGMVPWFACESAQNYSVLLKEVTAATSGSCAWAADKSASCKKKSKACGAPADPMSHRRRNCGRNDNSQDLDLAMQNAATNEFVESSCGTHQQFTDVASKTGELGACKVKGDITGNATALKMCLNQCCTAPKCIGISVKPSGTTLQTSFDDAEVDSGSMSYLHRQR